MWESASEAIVCRSSKGWLWRAGMEGEEGRSSKRSAAAKKPRTKQLLCEQDPEAPGLTLDQRRKIRRRALGAPRNL